MHSFDDLLILLLLSKSHSFIVILYSSKAKGYDIRFINAILLGLICEYILKSVGFTITFVTK